MQVTSQAHHCSRLQAIMPSTFSTLVAITTVLVATAPACLHAQMTDVACARAASDIATGSKTTAPDGQTVTLSAPQGFAGSCTDQSVCLALGVTYDPTKAPISGPCSTSDMCCVSVLATTTAGSVQVCENTCSAGQAGASFSPGCRWFPSWRIRMGQHARTCGRECTHMRT
jgi:hypothetical protein